MTIILFGPSVVTINGQPISRMNSGVIKMRASGAPLSERPSADAHTSETDEDVLYDAIIRQYPDSCHITATPHECPRRSHGWIGDNPAACLREMDTKILPSWYNGRRGQARHVEYRSLAADT